MDHISCEALVNRCKQEVLLLLFVSVVDLFISLVQKIYIIIHLAIHLCVGLCACVCLCMCCAYVCRHARLYFWVSSGPAAVIAIALLV